MSPNVIVRSSLVLPLLLLAASQATAQTEKEISVGYSFISTDGIEFPTGGYVSFAEGRGPVRGVMDFTFQRNSGGGALAIFFGGVRIGPRTGRVRPFGQAMLGFAAHSVSDGGAAWVTAFGGGIDIPIQANRLALRLGVDLPVFFGGSEMAIRSTVGIVYGW